MDIYVVEINKKDIYFILADDPDSAEVKVIGTLTPAQVKPPGGKVKYMGPPPNAKARLFQEPQDGKNLTSMSNVTEIELSNGTTIHVGDSPPIKINEHNPTFIF